MYVFWGNTYDFGLNYEIYKEDTKFDELSIVY